MGDGATNGDGEATRASKDGAKNLWQARLASMMAAQRSKNETETTETGFRAVVTHPVAAANAASKLLSLESLEATAREFEGKTAAERSKLEAETYKTLPVRLGQHFKDSGMNTNEFGES